MDYLYGRRPARKPKIAQYCRLVKKDGTLNVQYIGSPVKYNVSNMYHDIVDKDWPYLIVLITVMYTTCALFFAFLYWIDGGVLRGESIPSHPSQDLTFPEAYYFSIQTQDTIGYGNLYPGDQVLTNLITALQSWLSMLVYATITGIVFTKLSRPSKIKNNILFSSNAVINNTSSLTFAPNTEGGDETEGEYKSGEEPCLVFRIANVRKAQLCAASFTLLCVSYKPSEHGEQYTTQAMKDRIRILECAQELNFEINQQVGRVRGMNFSVPQLNLPWNVVHPIDKSSPLYGLTAKEVIRNRIEIIAVLDAIDEACSDNFQARSSYTANDIHWQCEFADMLASVDKNKVSEHLKAVRQQSLLRRRLVSSVEKAKRPTLTGAPPRTSNADNSNLGLRKLINNDTVISKAQPVSPMIQRDRRYSGGGMQPMPRLGVMSRDGLFLKSRTSVAPLNRQSTGESSRGSASSSTQKVPPHSLPSSDTTPIGRTSEDISLSPTATDREAAVPRRLDGEPKCGATTGTTSDNEPSEPNVRNPKAADVNTVNIVRREQGKASAGSTLSDNSAYGDAVVDIQNRSCLGHSNSRAELVGDDAVYLGSDGVLVADFSLFDTVLPLPDIEVIEE